MQIFMQTKQAGNIENVEKSKQQNIFSQTHRKLPTVKIKMKNKQITKTCVDQYILDSFLIVNILIMS